MFWLWIILGLLAGIAIGAVAVHVRQHHCRKVAEKYYEIASITYDMYIEQRKRVIDLASDHLINLTQHCPPTLGQWSSSLRWHTKTQIERLVSLQTTLARQRELLVRMELSPTGLAKLEAEHEYMILAKDINDLLRCLESRDEDGWDPRRLLPKKRFPWRRFYPLYLAETEQLIQERRADIAKTIKELRETLPGLVQVHDENPEACPKKFLVEHELLIAELEKSLEENRAPRGRLAGCEYDDLREAYANLKKYTNCDGPGGTERDKVAPES